MIPRAALGSSGQSIVVNDDGDALIFGGPFQPLPAPNNPSNVRATDAFDARLRVDWGATANAGSYEWQQRLNGDSWPDDDMTTTSTNSGSITVTNAAQDFRVLAVNGVLKSGRTELLNIPVIETPTPATANSLSISRVSPGRLRFNWNDLDVNNGGSGSTLVNKNASYRYQYRAESSSDWGAVRTGSTSTNVTASGLTNGTNYEFRVRGIVTKSDDGSDVEGLWSNASTAQRPVKNTVTMTYGVANSRTGTIIDPRTIEIPVSGDGVEFEAINADHPITAGQYNVLDIARGDEYSTEYDIDVLETRPLVTDITAGSSYMAEAEPDSGSRRYSVGPSQAFSVTITWYVEVS